LHAPDSAIEFAAGSGRRKAASGPIHEEWGVSTRNHQSVSNFLINPPDQRPVVAEAGCRSCGYSIIILKPATIRVRL
jgi:hypothetical protein